MIHFGGASSWFGAAELAELKLPGLPTTKRKINELAEAGRWLLRVDAAGYPLHRKRAGRGGGYEYNYAVLPQAAIAELIRRGLIQAAPKGAADSAQQPAPGPTRDGLWSWFDQQADSVKDEAKRRLKVIEAVETRVRRAGMSVTAAVAAAAIEHDVSVATIHAWRKAVKGARLDDYLPRLAPRRVGGGQRAEIDDGAWQFFLSAYLRFEEPTVTKAYDDLIELYAKPRGLEVPHIKTFKRRVDSDVDGRVVISRRKGADALRQTVPYQQRSVAGLSALQLVNIDGHKWDVFVEWPGSDTGKPVIARPMMVAIQDVYSRKILAWRIGETESAHLTRLAFADLFSKWGIPEGCLLDNGRAFASKWITGGAKSRFRFTIREDDPTGLLPALGVNPHWALPYRGSSKPIERAFNTLCKHGAKDLVFAGAYVGNKPDAKPENYGEKAVPLDVFVKRVDQIIAAHNRKQGRRTEMARGRSYDDAWNDSYSVAPIRKATPDQLKLALLTADRVNADRKTGEIRFMGNRYYDEAGKLFDVRGQQVVIRFDPDNLHDRVHVYAADGRFVCEAEVKEAVGFLDMESAKTRMRQEADFRRRTRELEKHMDLLSAQQLVDAMPDDLDDEEPDAPTPSVIRPVRPSGRAVVALATQQQAARASLMDRFADALGEPATAAKRPSLTILDGGLE